MKKEFVMVFLIVGMPAFFILMLHGGGTGSVVNEMSEIRIERINLYLDFPRSMYNQQTRLLTSTTRSYLRLGANREYYQWYGMSHNGDLFFDSEEQLVDDLQTLACVDDTQLCDFAVREQALRTLSAVMDLDYRIVGVTIENSNCPQRAQESYERAENAIIQWDMDNALVFLREAWSKATFC